MDRWSVAVSFAVLLGAVVVPSVASAQSFDVNPENHTFSDFGQCFNEAAEVAIADQGPEPQPPPDGSSIAFLNPETFLRRSWECSLTFAVDVFVPTSRTVLWSLAILMLVWYGIQHMFGRGFNLSSLLNYFMLIGFGLIVLDNYHEPSHDLFPADQGFVEVIAEQVIGWSQDLYRTTEIEFDRAFVRSRAILDAGADTTEFALENDPDDAEDAVSRLNAAIDQFDQQAAGEDGYGSFSEFVLSVIVSTLHRLIGIVLWVIRWILVGQYMWGWFMLSLLSLVGPLFVPAIVISQVDWLFWNWLRGLFAACIYMLSAAALYAVSMILLLTPLTRINNAFSAMEDPSAGFGAAMLWLGVGFIEYIPIFFLVSYMSLQAGTISSGLMSGTGPSSLSMAARALKRGISYTAGAAPVLASGAAQRGAKAGVAGLGAYRWLRSIGSGPGGPGDADPGGGGDSGGGSPDRAGPGGPIPSGGPATASMGPGGGPSAFNPPGLSPAERAALSARLTMETNAYLDSRVADRLADMGHPSVGGGARERLREVESAQPFTTVRRPDGAFETTGDRADAPASEDRRDEQYAYQAARIASLHHVLLWDDAQRSGSSGAAEIGPAGDPGGTDTPSGSAEAAQAAAAAAESASSSTEEGGRGFFQRARDLREGFASAFEPTDRTVADLGHDFDSRVSGGIDRGRQAAVDWTRRKARDRWRDYWGKDPD